MALGLDLNICVSQVWYDFLSCPQDPESELSLQNAISSIPSYVTRQAAAAVLRVTCVWELHREGTQFRYTHSSMPLHMHV